MCTCFLFFPEGMGQCCPPHSVAPTWDMICLQALPCTAQEAPHIWGRAAANLRWISKGGEGKRPLARTWPNHPTTEEPVTPVGLRPQRHSSLLEWDEPSMFTALVCLSHRHVLLPPITSCRGCHRPHPNLVHSGQLRATWWPLSQGSQDSVQRAHTQLLCFRPCPRTHTELCCGSETAVHSWAIPAQLTGFPAGLRDW